MKKDFFKDYSKLTPYERFRLVVKAMARSDTACLKQLVNSCRTDKGQFARLLDAARSCTMVLVPSITEMMGRWEMFNAMMHLVPIDDQIDYFYDTYRHSPGLSEDVGRIAEKLLELLAECPSETEGPGDISLLEWRRSCMEFVSGYLLDMPNDAEDAYVSCVCEMPGDSLMDKFSFMLTCHGRVASQPPRQNRLHEC